MSVRRLAFVGPLPPPVNGFYVICGLMLGLLRTRLEVKVFNRAPAQGRLRTALTQGLLHPAFVCRILRRQPGCRRLHRSIRRQGTVV